MTAARIAAAAVFAAAAAASVAAAPLPGLTDVQGDMGQQFACEVDRRLEVPEEERQAYGLRLRALLEAAVPAPLEPQHVLLVDRSPFVQAAFLYRVAPSGELRFAGASPVSTGLPGAFEHFETPLGVFENSLDNPDFRAEGTQNESGVRGYGRAGMRVFDFGWVRAPKGWGDRAQSVMRLQVHATDPELLEPQLGRPRSKGCIRIPASLDLFLDRHGILDADYEKAASAGGTFWILPRAREMTRWPGKYLVIVDSERRERPEWARPSSKPLARPAECQAPR